MILLSQNDAQFLIKVLSLTEQLKQILEKAPEQGIALADEAADEMRDLCCDRLQIHGFDENYKLTEEGQRLEDLIDKLFVG